MNHYDDYDQNYTYDSGLNEYDSHSGDLQRDLDYDRQYLKMSDVVKKFLQYFCSTLNEGLIFELQNIYENTFPKLTEKFFDKSPWPDAEEVAVIVHPSNNVFLICYKELYYRHIFARVPGGPTLEQRLGSFYNYCNLFNCILGAQEPVTLELPDQWLWELVDEFIYQYQSFTQYYARRLLKKEDNLEELNFIEEANFFNIHQVLNVLHSLVEKSNIKRQLEVYASGGDPDSVAGDFGRQSLYKMLGYFSLVGLLRLHSLLGDYYRAIKVLENIELHKKSQYSHVPACQISTAYYVGFAYMMMRRYTDAIRTFSSILLFIQRTKQLFQTRTYQNDQINKQTEQMYHLLAICLVLHPQCIDESIQQVLREKNYHEKMYKMQYGELEEFEACFIFACPKFLSPIPPPQLDSSSSDSTPSGLTLSGGPADAPKEDFVKEAMKHQIQVFMDEVRQQKMIPTIRSYLKLYRTLPLSKLAALMYGHEHNAAVEKELQIHLLCFKHKMKNIVWTKGTSGLEGSFQSGSELDFYIDNDMIHIADTKVAPPYGDFFIRKIHKFDELNRKLQSIKIQ